MPLIRIETLIAAPAAVCFDVMRDVRLHMQSVAHTGERAVAGRTSGLFESGDEVTWEARHLGIRQRLTVRITRCEPPALFEDIQARGAFASFKHLHRFLDAEAGTNMIDEFDYRSPLGFAGRLADLLFLERYMRRLLERRAAFLRAEAEARVGPYPIDGAPGE
jgi:ligand-binding SRPBCC domain-containing protein